MKNHGSWHRSDQAEWEGDCRPNGLIRLLADDSRFSDCVWLFAEESANGLRFG